MLTLNIDSINSFFFKTSSTLAEQQVRNEEENTDISVLENNRESLNILFDSYEKLREELSPALTENTTKKDLIILQDHLNSLHRILQKEHKSLYSNKKLRKSLKPELENLKICISDLKEFLEDIEKRINPDPEIEALLNKIVNY